MLDGRKVDLRVSTFPGSRGEKTVIRVLDTRNVSLNLRDLGFGEDVLELFQQSITAPNGIVLVTGPTGSGKSTTLYAALNEVASMENNVCTVEDPIEYIHTFKNCVVTQREIRLHAPTLADALRDAVREDPDVILVGELRSAEEISLALTAAETGVQIYGTLHTSGAARTIDRVINTFPANRQEQARSMLADSLRMILSQRLLRTADGSRRVAALEILVNTKAVKSNIRAATSHKLASVIQTGAAAGMRTMDSSLLALVDKGTVSPSEAVEHASDPTLFESRGVRVGEPA